MEQTEQIVDIDPQEIQQDQEDPQPATPIPQQLRLAFLGYKHKYDSFYQGIFKYNKQKQQQTISPQVSYQSKEMSSLFDRFITKRTDYQNNCMRSSQKFGSYWKCLQSNPNKKNYQDFVYEVIPYSLLFWRTSLDKCVESGKNLKACQKVNRPLFDNVMKYLRKNLQDI